MKVAITGDSGELGVALARGVEREGGRASRIAPAWLIAQQDPESVTWLAEPGAEIGATLRDLRPDVVVHFPWVACGGVLRRRRRLTIEATLATAEAAQEADAQHFVYWGSVAAYAGGAGATARPLVESDALATGGTEFELAEAERRLRAWAERERGLSLTVFRAAPVLGVEPVSVLERLLDLRLLPRIDHDVPMQFLHPEDAVAILWRAARGALPGVYNAAADGVLLYSELVRALGRTSLRVPRALAWTALVLQAGVGGGGRLRAALETSRVVDNARLKTHFGYRPRRCSRQAIVYARRRAAAPEVHR